ncbi:GntR family transcriptional regulator [Spirochaeta isovalerica]|uniref:DNA-binding transcriptional regulator YhcF (GntR family) n=1 Tax=Spirochaeta isovalerica TaxID=150 RepID=A0A841RBM7_9SPIO|nr:GntR family transcriptional regulator [Spirochaeta isovalerica]MBB6479812.1 DNA-binding transcriptional regulator YhcF (GntR family) [Spirochaeta isovalerica]
MRIDRNSTVPVYRQITQNITLMVKQGKLKPGDKVVPERELATALNLSRGTVKKAYGELENNNVLEVVQGRGSFISRNQDVLIQSRKDRAVQLIDNALTELEALNFSHREITTFFQLMLMNREQKINSFHIAAVDCNSEALTVFEKQLRYISGTRISKYLLDDVVENGDPERLLSGFDVILTTSTHYNELSAICPALKERILQAALTLGQETIIDLASIKPESRIGTICITERFHQIVKDRMTLFGLETDDVSYLCNCRGSDFHNYLENKDVVILPSEMSVSDNWDLTDALDKFSARGGKIINFDYQIDRGSLIYIEEQISNRMERL